jgi:hypothetical protein
MSDYKVKVVVSVNKLSTKDIENKITDFQSVFATIASRYYNNKNKAGNKIVGNLEAE